MNLRLISARVIHEVTNGRSLTESLDTALSLIKDARDKALVQAICYGVCRYYSRLDIALSFLLTKPMKAKDSDVHALLLVGLYQLMEMRIPDYAAVTETVNAVDGLQKQWARALVNAVLRSWIRRKTEIEEKMAEEPESVFAHPNWWITHIKKAWPNVWETILEANNVLPPFALRVNERRLTREAYLQKLKVKEMEASILPETRSGIILNTAVPLDELPGFTEGDVSVQDGAAQLAAELLELAPKERVLDACAAPGGKLTHILEIEPNLSYVAAIEKDKNRLLSIEENLTRLGHHHCHPRANGDPFKIDSRFHGNDSNDDDLVFKVHLICKDAKDTTWWDEKPFDRILLDAPCSASGVIRRHPDIKLLRQPTDIKKLAKEQLQLLTSLWPLLKPNGLLVYATCSIFPEENEQVIHQFLQSQPDAKEEKIEATWGITSQYGRQILPGMHQMDGFYYAKIRKIKS